MTAKTAELVIPSQSTDMAEVRAVFDAAKKAGWNVLIPETLIVGLADNYAIAFAQTTVSLDLADQEIYADDGSKDSEEKRFRLQKTAIMRISGPYMAGLKWSAKDSGIETFIDNYIAFKSVASIMAPDGQEIPFVGHDDLDFIVLEEKYRESYTAKAKILKKDKEYNNPESGKRPATDKEKEEYISYCVRRDLLQKREHKLALVETGAMERVARGAIGLKNSYSKKQLRMPFLTARVIQKPDYSNPLIKNAALAAGKEASKNIFGTDKPPIDIGKNDKKPEEPDSMLIDFENSDDAGQCKAITDLARAKGYDLAGYLKRAQETNNSVKSLSDIPKPNRMGLFTHIRSLAAKQPLDDVPY